MTAAWFTGDATALAQATGRVRGRPVTQHEVEPVTFGALQIVSALKPAQHLAALHALHLRTRRMGAFHQHHGLLLTPTLADPPARPGHLAATAR